MAARFPRRSFAAPIVVTLGACYVQSTPTPPHENPPAPQDPQRPNENPPPTVVANPPRPQPPTEQTPPSTETVKWSVYKSQDGTGCMAAIKANCPPKAMCNPPPPFKYECPKDITIDAGGVTVASYDGGATCAIDYGPMNCPKGAMCNPP